MNMRQVWGIAGGFFLVYILITVTNRPAVKPHAIARSNAPAGAAFAPAPGGPAALPGHPALIGRLVPVAQTQPRPAATTLARDFQRGVCLLAPGTSGLKDPAIDRAFEAIAAAGGSWVAICPALGQERADSPTVGLDALNSPTEAALADAIARAHARHLKVMLRPRVTSRDGALPETFGPRDAGAWLGSYQRAIASWLDLAKRQDVELVCLGGPFSHIERASGWTALIRDARSRFPGKLTYAAASADDRGEGGFQQVPFWGDLDYIGIDAFGPAGPGAAADESRPAGDGAPADAAANDVWRGFADGVEGWVSAHGQGKGVLLTSVAIPADQATGTASGPQARAVGQVFEAIAGRSWLAGAYWLGWDAGDTRAAGAYGPIGPAAVQVIQAHYTAN